MVTLNKAVAIAIIMTKHEEFTEAAPAAQFVDIVGALLVVLLAMGVFTIMGHFAAEAMWRK